MSETQKRGSRLWRTLNAPFVIFVFSSIVLGGAVWAYGEYQDYKRRVQAKSRQMDRLESELFFRMGALESTVEQMVMMRAERDDTALNQIESDLGRYSDAVRCPPSQCSNIPSMFPKFDEYNLIGLFHFLSELEPEATFYSQQAVNELEKGLRYARETRRLIANSSPRDTSINGKPSELDKAIGYPEQPVRKAMRYYLEWSTHDHKQRDRN